MSCQIAFEDCIPQESNYEFRVGFIPRESLTSWTCTLDVRLESDSVLQFTRVITDLVETNTKFLINLLPSETNLPPDFYIVAIQVTSFDLTQSQEIRFRLEIKDDWVF